MSPTPSDDFLRRLARPEIATPQHQQQLKMTLLSTRKTAALGVWLVVVPCFFLACVLMKYTFAPHAQLADTFLDAVARIDHSPRGWWLSPLIFLLLPLLGAVLNLLAVLHVQLDRSAQLLVITLKLRLLNLLLLALSVLILVVIGGYLVAENLLIRN